MAAIASDRCSVVSKAFGVVGHCWATSIIWQIASEFCVISPRTVEASARLSPVTWHKCINNIECHSQMMAVVKPSGGSYTGTKSEKYLKSLVWSTGAVTR